MVHKQEFTLDSVSRDTERERGSEGKTCSLVYSLTLYHSHTERGQEKSADLDGLDEQQVQSKISQLLGSS